MTTGLTLKRTFDAPRGRVWEMWTNPVEFAKWFGGTDSTLTDVEMDVKAGGSWSVVMHIESAPDIPWKGEYREVNKPEKLVMTFLDTTDLQNYPEAEVVTVEFKETDGKTEMAFNQSGHMPEAEYQKGLKEGWTIFFDRLSKGMV